MTDEIDTVAVEESAAPEDLRSQIASAVAAQKAQADSEPAPEETTPEPIAEQAQETAEQKADRLRDEKGRFAAKEPSADVTPAPATETPPVEAEKPAEGAKTYRPPVGWSVNAKAEFDKLPDAVREAIAKREEEVDTGFKRYGGLKQYAEIAEQGGTTLASAVKDYFEIETALRQDFLGGLERVCARFGVDPRSATQALNIRYGVNPGIGMPDGQQQPSQPAAIDPDALLRQAEQRIEEKLAQRETLSAIQAFANDPKNVYFDNVREDMATLINAGKASNLQEAYEAACWLNPEIRALRLNERSVPAAPAPAAKALQTAKAAAKAVGGAPSPGFKPDAQGMPANSSIRDNIRAAINMQRG